MRDTSSEIIGSHIGGLSLSRCYLAAPWAVVSLLFGSFILVLFFRSYHFPNADDFPQLINFILQWNLRETWSSQLELLFYDIAAHPHLTTKAFVLLSYALLGELNLRLMMVLGGLALPLLLYFLVKIYPIDFRCSVALISALLLFQPQYSEAIFWASASMTFIWVFTFAIVAIWAIENNRSYSAFFAIICASATMANGLILPFVCFSFALLKKRYRLSLILLGWGVIGITLYLFARQGVVSEVSLDFIGTMRYAVQLTGCAIGYADSSLSFYSGLVILTFLIGFSIKLLFDRQLAILSFTLFVVLSIFLTSIGRIGFAPESAYTTSRYAFLSVLTIILVLNSALKYCCSSRLFGVSNLIIFLAFLFNFHHNIYYWPQAVVRYNLMARNRLLYEVEKGEAKFSSHNGVLNKAKQHVNIEIGKPKWPTIKEVECFPDRKLARNITIEVHKVIDDRTLLAGWYFLNQPPLFSKPPTQIVLTTSNGPVCYDALVFPRPDVTYSIRRMFNHSHGRGYGFQSLVPSDVFLKRVNRVGLSID
jgi:hypothetical protein